MVLWQKRGAENEIFCIDPRQVSLYDDAQLL